MTGFARASVGAIVGAIVTLVLHPVSRPYLTSAWLPLSSPLGEPISLAKEVGGDAQEEAYCRNGLVLRMAADRLDKLSPAETAAYLDLANEVGNRSVDDAFWRQMAAVFAWRLGRKEDALNLLRKSQMSKEWRDYQTLALQHIQDRIQSTMGAGQSWEFARVYWMRSLAPAEEIGLMEQGVISESSLDTEDGLLNRIVVMQNAALMRDNAQSLAAGQIGADVVEDACQPTGSVESSSRRLFMRYRGEFFDKLRARGHPELVSVVNELYEKNDSWEALINDTEAPDIVQSLSFYSIITGSIPGALIAGAAFGLFLWGLGFLIERSRRLQGLLRFPAILIFALIFALVTFGITQLPVAAVAIGACASIAGLTPRHNRSRPPSRLGPFFSFLTGALAVVFLFVMTGYFVTGSTGAFQVLEAMRLVDKQEATRQTLLGIALIILSVLCLAAPMWAFAQRIRTPAVLSQGLKRFGAAVAVVGLVLGVVASPVAIYFDRHLQDTLYRLVVNEPYNYYLIRTR